MNTSKLLVAGAAMVMSAAAFAGGSHNDEHGHGGNIGEPGKAAKVDKTITVEMHDNYYTPETITVKSGQTVKFVVVNKGNLVHEFNIGTPEMHEAHQEEMMMMVEHGVIQGGKLNREMMEMDMGNGQTMKHNDPNSVLLEPGQSKEVIWKFTRRADIEFACNVPGHYQSGMYGDVNFN